jgi:hypothetical protein
MARARYASKTPLTGRNNTLTPTSPADLLLIFCRIGGKIFLKKTPLDSTKYLLPKCV